MARLASAIVDGASLPVIERMRLAVAIQARGRGGHRFTALNEVNVHRGTAPHLARLQCSVNGALMTTSVSDGYVRPPSIVPPCPAAACRRMHGTDAHAATS